MFALRGKLIVIVWFKKRNMECVVYLHRRWKLELICVGSYFSEDFERSDFLIIQLPAWFRGSYIS